MSRSARPVTREQPLLLFLHIPKTGGTTLENMICAEYSRHASEVVFFEPGFCLCEPGLGDQMAAISATAEPGVRAITGHFPYGLHEHLQRQCSYLTLLRDPVDRVLSLYGHFFLWGDDRHGVRRHRLTLEEFITQVGCPDVDNGQTRRLSGWTAPTAPPREVLDVACGRLSSGDVLAGLTERHGESLALFSRLLGWSADVPPPALVNARRPAREAVPASVIRLIRERNTLDSELLAHARALFTQRMSGYRARPRLAMPGTG